MKMNYNLEIFKAVAKRLYDMTDCWYGLADVQNGFWLALREQDERSAVVNWDEADGLQLLPDVGPGVVAGLNELVGAALVNEAMLRAALALAMQECLGPGGGTMVVWREDRQLKLLLVPFGEVLQYIERAESYRRAGVSLN